MYHLKNLHGYCFLSYIYFYYAIICIYRTTVGNIYNRMGRHAGPIVSQFSSFAAVLNVIFSVSLFFHTKFEEYASVDRVILFCRTRNNDYPSCSPDKERPELHAYYSYTLCTGLLRNRVAQLSGETTRRYRIWETKS